LRESPSIENVLRPKYSMTKPRRKPRADQTGIRTISLDLPPFLPDQLD
jgi:hypothetical protein